MKVEEIQKVLIKFYHCQRFVRKVDQVRFIDTIQEFINWTAENGVSGLRIDAKLLLDSKDTSFKPDSVSEYVLVHLQLFLSGSIYKNKLSAKNFNSAANRRYVMMFLDACYEREEAARIQFDFE